jgi:hypothetical protein
VKHLDGIIRRPVVRDWEGVRGDIHDPTLRRAIILGDPGFGKSWLLYFDGWRLATDWTWQSLKGRSLPVCGRFTAMASRSCCPMSASFGR